MNLLILCHELPPIGGGSGNAALSVATELARSNNVVVITAGYLGLPKLERTDNLEIVRVPAFRKDIEGSTPFELLIFSLTATVAALRLHRSRKFDGCFVFHATASAWVAWTLNKLCGLPYVLLLRGADVPGFMPSMYAHLHWAAQWMTRRCWENARKIIANSSGLQQLAGQTASKLNLYVEMVPNGVDSEFFHPLEPKNGRSNILKAVVVGRLTEQKGIIYLLEAVNHQSKKLKNKMALEIVGEGPLKSELEKYVLENNLGSIVHFTEWLDKPDLLKTYQSSDLLVFPSLEEGMSNVILEAMACGLPIVGMDIYGNSDLIYPGVNGFLVPPKDPPALGQLLVKLIEMNPARLSDMGKQCRSRSLKLSWKAVADSYMRALGSGF